MGRKGTVAPPSPPPPFGHRSVDGVWGWTDGTPVVYANWAPGAHCLLLPRNKDNVPVLTAANIFFQKRSLNVGNKPKCRLYFLLQSNAIQNECIFAPTPPTRWCVQWRHVRPNHGPEDEKNRGKGAVEDIGRNFLAIFNFKIKILF